MNPLELRRLRVEVNEAESSYTNEKFYGHRPERLPDLDAKVKAARARLREAVSA